MKSSKKWMALGLALLMVAFVLAGCAPSIEKQLQQAMEKMAGVKSMDSTIEMTMKMKMMGQSLDINMVGEMSAFDDPVKAKMDMKTNAMGQEQESVVYVEQDGDKLITYVNAGTGWEKEEMTSEAFGEKYKQMQVQQSMELYLKSAKNFKDAGTEKIDGRKTRKLEGVISGEDLSDVMVASGMLDAMGDSMAGMDEDMLKRIYNDLVDLPVIIWLDQAEHLVVKYEMDMAPMMTKIFESLLGELGAQASGVKIKVNECKMIMTLKNFDNATDFTIPDEAKEAA